MTKLKVVPFRRKGEGKTNYRKRIKILMTSKPRIVVRPTLKNMVVQFVEFKSEGDKVLVGGHSRALQKYGWNFGAGNLPAAYLTGYLIGKLALKKGIKEAVLDTGVRMPTRGGRIYACVKGILDAGVNVSIDKSVLPSEERIKGEHIAKYSKGKEGIVELFEKVKSSIGKGVGEKV